MRILFMPQAGALGIGGITRCLAVACEAALWGHEVGFFCKAQIFPMLQGLDATLFEAPAPPPPQMDAAVNYKLADSIRIRSMDDPAYLESTIEAELAAYRAFRPDVIFTENQFSAAISTAVASLPLVSTAAWRSHPDFQSPLYDERRCVKGVEDNFNIILRRYRLEPIQDVWELANGRSALNLAPVIPDLEPRLAEFPNTHFVGALLSLGIELGPVPLELSEDPSRPLIYVYMSVGSITPEQYVPELVKAFSGSSFQVAVALRLDTFCGRRLPLRLGNVFLYRLLPGMAMARRSAVVITRGGQNTLMSCMLTGTPVIGFPGDGAEADFVMDGIVRLGVGLKCQPEEFRAPKVREIVESVMASAEYRARTASAADKIRSYGGAPAALQLISKLI